VSNSSRTELFANCIYEFTRPFLCVVSLLRLSLLCAFVICRECRRSKAYPRCPRSSRRFWSNYGALSKEAPCALTFLRISTSSNASMAIMFAKRVWVWTHPIHVKRWKSALHAGREFDYISSSTKPCFKKYIVELVCDSPTKPTISWLRGCVMVAWLRDHTKKFRRKCELFYLYKIYLFKLWQLL
jgi:hypothetical protein